LQRFWRRRRRRRTSRAAEAAVVDEIVVTAQRREQSLRDVPVSVSVFDEAFLEKSRVDTIDDLATQAPGLSGTAVSTTTPRITVRGVSTDDFGVGSDPALGVYIDDVYLGRGVSSISDLFDVARVEVIKGPQGTLFGRNTTAGAISVTTNRPTDDLEANIDVSYSRFDDVQARGAVNLPLGDGVALRLAASTRTREGPFTNTLGGRLGGIDSQAVRGTFGLERGPLDLTVSLEHRSTRNAPGPYLNPDLVGGERYGPVPSTGAGRPGGGVRRHRQHAGHPPGRLRPRART
jgi:iron complex outermembrane receptor protein